VGGLPELFVGFDDEKGKQPLPALEQTEQLKNLGGLTTLNGRQGGVAKLWVAYPAR
jgi:hypothetical protein